MVIVVVVATGAICAGSGHFWGNSSIYYSLQFMVEQLVMRTGSKSDEKEEYWNLREKEGEEGMCWLSR